MPNAEDIRWFKQQFGKKIDAAVAGTPFDLDMLFRELGVSLDARDHIVFDDRAPLASVRHALIFGAPSRPSPLADGTER